VDVRPLLTFFTLWVLGRAASKTDSEEGIRLAVRLLKTVIKSAKSTTHRQSKVILSKLLIGNSVSKNL